MRSQNFGTHGVVRTVPGIRRVGVAILGTVAAFWYQLVSALQLVFASPSEYRTAQSAWE